MKLLYHVLALYSVGLASLYAHDIKNCNTERRPLSTLSPLSPNFNYSDAFQQGRPSTTNNNLLKEILKRPSLEDTIKNKITPYFEEPKLSILEDKNWKNVLPTLVPKNPNSKITLLTVENFYQEEKQKKEEDLISTTLRLIKAAQQLKRPSYQWKKPIKADDLLPVFLNKILEVFPQFFVTQYSDYSVENISYLEKLMSNIGYQYGFSPTVSQFVLTCIWKAHTKHLIS
jgi:hypothetical protein